MTTSELAREVYAIVEAKIRSAPSPVEFEMAYQARVAMDRIKFAIKQTEQFAPQIDQMREVCLQLLEALDGLESAERKFQSREYRAGFPLGYRQSVRAVNGKANQDNLKGVI